MEQVHSGTATFPPKWATRFLLDQGVYFSVALIVMAIFWAINLPINPDTVVLYALCFGNLITSPVRRIQRWVAERSVVFKSIVFLASLIVLTPVVYVISTTIVWKIAPPSPQPLWHLLTTGWRFPALAIVVYVALGLFYGESKARLERRNVELQKSIEQGAARLEMQEQELHRAREIQQSLLPHDIPQLPGFEVAAAWQPARQVGGDYFDVLRLSDTQLAICIADVVGKGVSAALLMANVQAAVRAFARDSESPAQVCSRVNSVLCENIAIGKYVTFFYGVLDSAARTLRYCNAGHLRPILASAGTTHELCDAGGAVLGAFPTWHYEEASVTLARGDRLLLFTDGITEAADLDEQEFGEEKVAALAKGSRAASASALTNRVLAQASEFCHAQFQDDATLLVVAVT